MSFYFEIIYCNNESIFCLFLITGAPPKRPLKSILRKRAGQRRDNDATGPSGHVTHHENDDGSGGVGPAAPEVTGNQDLQSGPAGSAAQRAKDSGASSGADVEGNGKCGSSE